VAVAVLILEGRELHYKEIADRVVRSGLTKLGNRGLTPDQSINNIMTTQQTDDGRGLFESFGQGSYYLREPENAKRVPNVKTVLELLRLKDGARSILEDVEKVQRQTNISTTTKEALVSARLGQGKFRDDVLRIWQNRCAVTRSVTHAAIRASHIKPWRSSTDEERLDPNNGLALVASLDALFDTGLISFESSGQLIVSPKLETAERKIFCVMSASLTQKPNAKMADYLSYHRKLHKYDE
jgi:hypothetical protein